MFNCQKCHSLVTSGLRCHECGTDHKKTEDGDFVLSAVVGAVTNSTVIGTIVGGNLLGGLLGDIIGGDDDSLF